MEILDLLEVMLKAGASDLHLKAGNKPFLRVDGGMLNIEDMPRLNPVDTERLVLGMLNDEQKQLFFDDWEIDFAYALGDRARFRVNAFHQRGTVAAVFRVIPTRIKTVEDLALPQVMRDLCKLPRGLILVTGPTGSGKSTTLAAMVDLINTSRDEHIITIEDPIEFVHRNKKSLVNQREVGHDTDSFHAALKSALRQDPDVVLIGEMRDLETISTAITTAETGHLVLATLHTTGAAQTVDRIIDVFPPEQQAQIRMQMSGNIQGIISQILVPKIGGRGRVAAFEIMVPTPAMRNLIRDGKTYQIPSQMLMGKSVGMVTLEQSLAELVRKRVITKEMAMAKAMDVQAFEEVMKGG